MRFAVAGATGTVGREVVAVARRRGHEVVTMSRAAGQDVETGAGVDAALAGVHAVIDVTSVGTLSAARSVEFFTAASECLLAAEKRQGVPHHIALSIVGIDAVPFGYYAGKLAQERVVTDAVVPYSILRATQFHEFAGQLLSQSSFGPVALVPAGLVRPVAASEVAESLVTIAERDPVGRARDLRGPRDETLLNMARRLMHADGTRRLAIGVSLPGDYWRGLRGGALRGSADSDEGTLTFDEWLARRETR